MIHKGSLSFAAILCLNLLSIASTNGQGLPSFASYSGSSFDSINNANLDVHAQFPFVSRAGRGTPFSYGWTYDSLIWSPQSASGTQVWTPAANWGWSTVTQPELGYINYQSATYTCKGQYSSETFTIWQNFSYVDGQGTAHIFPIVVSNYQGSTCGPASNFPSNTAAAQVANDGSGYSMGASADSTNVNMYL